MDSSRRVQLVEANTESTSLLGRFSHQKLRTGTLRRSCGAPTSGRSCDLESRFVHSLNTIVENFYGGDPFQDVCEGFGFREKSKVVSLLQGVFTSYAYCCQFGVPCDVTGLNLGRVRLSRRAVVKEDCITRRAGGW